MEGFKEMERHDGVMRMTTTVTNKEVDKIYPMIYQIKCNFNELMGEL